MSIKLIINPAAGRGKASKLSKRVIYEFEKRGIDFDYEYSAKSRHAVEISRKASTEFQKVIAVGGDGTVNEVGEGLVGSDAIFGVIPLGSGNDFAKENGIPSKISDAVGVILSNNFHLIDVIKVNDRVSLNTAGVGFNGIVSEVAKSVKYLKGMSVYIWSVVKTAIRYKSIPLKISINGRLIEDNIFMVSICNSKSEGGGFIIAPNAKNDDGLFDVTIIRHTGYTKLLLNLNKALTGNLNKLKEVETIKGNSILIESEYPMPVHVDGEVISLILHKVEASILESSLKVIRNSS
ncbi:diacylglycerol kinase family lipid kinase [Candidatus Marinimicrobia bacterium MT.SAG.2]|nr:diacylglycerol kinase family lipid kinase [Candidatus Marinimicrobia bacterium MT.SAG.2]